MRIALRELRRRPSRFATATVILTLIAVLLMFLGGLLDGLLRDATGAVRAQDADLIVYSSTARDSFFRSRITPEQIQAVARKYLIPENLTIAILVPQALASVEASATANLPGGLAHAAN